MLLSTDCRDSNTNHPTLYTNIILHENCQEKGQNVDSLSHGLDLERPLEKVHKKKNTKQLRVITPLVIMTLDPSRSASPTMEEDHLKGGLSGKTNFSRP